MNIASLIAYLRRPFPAMKGLSAYRFPGLIVHLPIAFLFLAVGASLTLSELYLWPLLPLYLVTGIYIGRDLAVLAHTRWLITLAVIAGCIGLIASPDTYRMLVSGTRHPLVSVAISLTVAAGFGVWIRWRIGDEASMAAVSPLEISAAPVPDGKTRLFASGGMCLLAFLWIALVFLGAYRPEHPRASGFTWALWLLPFVAAAALALAFRSNSQVLRYLGPRGTIVLALKWILLLLALALPPALFVANYADNRLHARVARMIESVEPMKPLILANAFRSEGPSRAGEGIVWPADIKADVGIIGGDGTILVFDTEIGALAVISPDSLPDWRCVSYPRALAPRECRDYPVPTTLEEGSVVDFAQSLAALSGVATAIKVESLLPEAGAYRVTSRDGELDFSFMDAQGQVALYNDRHGILMLLHREVTGIWRCRLLVQGRAEASCPLF